MNNEIFTDPTSWPEGSLQRALLEARQSGARWVRRIAWRGTRAALALEDLYFTNTVEHLLASDWEVVY